MYGMHPLERAAAERTHIARPARSVPATGVEQAAAEEAAEEEKKEEMPGGHPQGHTAVLLAAARGHTCVLRALLSRGADAAAPNAVSGVTPLMAAADHGHTPVIDELLQALHRCQVKDTHTRAPACAPSLGRLGFHSTRPAGLPHPLGTTRDRQLHLGGRFSVARKRSPPPQCENRGGERIRDVLASWFDSIPSPLRGAY